MRATPLFFKPTENHSMHKAQYKLIIVRPTPKHVHKPTKMEHHAFCGWLVGMQKLAPHHMTKLNERISLYITPQERIGFDVRPVIKMPF